MLYEVITTYTGVKIIDGGSVRNAKYMQVILNKKTEKFCPDSVREYGINKGSTYFSKSIQVNDSVQKVFLERITAGKTNLYYFQDKNIKTYFLEKDSTVFIELAKGKVRTNHFRQTLSSYNFV